MEKEEQIGHCRAASGLPCPSPLVRAHTPWRSEGYLPLRGARSCWSPPQGSPGSPGRCPPRCPRHPRARRPPPSPARGARAGCRQGWCQRGASGGCHPAGAPAGCWRAARPRRSPPGCGTRGSAARGASTRCSPGSGDRRCAGTAAPWPWCPGAPGTRSTPADPAATTHPCPRPPPRPWPWPAAAAAARQACRRRPRPAPQRPPPWTRIARTLRAAWGRRRAAQLSRSRGRSAANRWQPASGWRPRSRGAAGLRQRFLHPAWRPEAPAATARSGTATGLRGGGWSSHARSQLPQGASRPPERGARGQPLHLRRRAGRRSATGEPQGASLSGLRAERPPAARSPAAGSEGRGGPGPGVAACAPPRAAAEPHRPRDAPCAPGPPATRSAQRVGPDPVSSSAASTCAGSARRSRCPSGAGKEPPSRLDLPSHWRAPATVLPCGRLRPPGNPSALLRRPGLVPSGAPRLPFGSQAGAFPPDAAAEESLVGVIPSAVSARAREQLGDISNTRAFTSAPGAPRSVPFQTARRSDTPELQVWVQGRPAKHEGKALGWPRVPGAGSGSSRRLPARPTPSRGTPDSAPPARPLPRPA